jgi:hypothetical protein
MPQTNREIAAHLLSTYRTFSSKQIPELTDRSTKLIQLELHKLAGEGKCWKTGRGRLNVYCDRENKHWEHDLLRTDFLIANQDSITRIVLDGIRSPEVNPDGYIEAGDSFFLEIERSNPATRGGESTLLTKALDYDRYAMRHGHKQLCENFRVIYVMRTEAKARNLADKIRQSVPNPERFWLTWEGNTMFVSVGGTSYALPMVSPRTDRNTA